MHMVHPQPWKRFKYSLGTFSIFSPTTFSHQEILKTLGFHSSINTNCR